MRVRVMFVPKPRIIFGRTSTPYAQAKNVSDNDFQPGDVTAIKASPPITTMLEATAIIEFRKLRVLRAARLAISSWLGTQSPPKL